jgi:hypothetical protein
MHKNATKCNETLSKWCKNKHGASKIIDTFEMYQYTMKSSPKDFVVLRLLLLVGASLLSSTGLSEFSIEMVGSGIVNN